MKLPKTFTYMHHTFSIEEGDTEVSEKTGNHYLGQVNWREDRIILYDEQTPQVMKSTLAHELYHIVLDRSGLDLDEGSLERLCDIMSYSLIEMALANPWFGEYFNDHS